MSFLNSYRRRLGSTGSNMGEALKKQSDTIMDKTFTRDIAYRKCYIDGNPVDAKYIVHSYYSISGDEVDYHIQFRPGIHYPVGTYIDIPDDVGKYNRWLLVARSDEPQFVKYSALKCNWNLKWVKNGIIHECLGVLRNQNSYNSGIWTDYYSTSPENQNKIWLPTNDVTRSISHNIRVLVSDCEGEQDPIAWQISKVENAQPMGITKVTLYQDLYDPVRDNKELMIADYYKSAVIPEENNTIEHKKLHIGYTLPSTVKVGGSFKCFKAVTPQDEICTDPAISWTLSGIEAEKECVVTKDEPGNLKIRVVKDYSLIGRIFSISLFLNGKLQDTIQVEVVSL